MAWAACFSPRTQEGLACSEQGGCPDGQFCVEGLCYRPGNSPPPDAAVDANTVQCSSDIVASGQDGAGGLDAQDTEYVYWTSGVGTLVLRSPKMRGPVEVFHDVGKGRHPFAVATDATHVYWTENDALGRIVRKPKDSLEGEPSEELASGQGEPVAIAVDATHVYWANHGGNSISRVPKAGGALELLATSQLQPTAIALDADSVYWVASGAGTVMRSAKAGAPVQELAARDAQLTHLAVADGSVFWTEPGVGEVRVVSKAGGDSAVFAGDQAQPGSIAATPEAVYWANEGSGAVLVAPFAGSGATEAADDQAGVAGLQVSAGAAYWLGSRAESRMVRASCSGF